MEPLKIYPQKEILPACKKCGATPNAKKIHDATGDGFTVYEIECRCGRRSGAFVNPKFAIDSWKEINRK